MIGFKINGGSLDLPEKTTVQLLRKNEIFAFDEIEVERSVSFEIPATPENNYILKLSNDYHCAGAFMRVKIAAQMIIGVVTRDGYLCLTQYDHKKKAYKAIFLFGQLLGLQRLRDAEKFNEMGLQTDLYIDGNSTIYNAPSATGETWAKVKYYMDTNPNGSVSVKLLTEMMSAQRPDLPAITLPAGTDGLRIIRAKMSGFDYAQKLKSTLNPDGGSQPDTDYPLEPYNLQEYDPTLFDVVTDIFGQYSTWQGGSSKVYYRIQGLKVLTPLSISFPKGMSNKWFLQKRAYTGGASGFYGGHWWEQGAPNAAPIIHGASLSGKTVEFAAGDEFYLVNVDDFRYTSAGGLTINGWMFVQQGATFPYDFTVKIAGESRYYLRDNMPDMTPLELCKIVAALTGTVLRYTETQGVWFDDLQRGWETRDLADVIERTTMERKFGDYAQHNYVRFEDEDNPQPLETVYTINNANLEEEKELQTMPLASGVTRVRNYYPAIDLATDKDTIADTIADSNFLQRVSLLKNAEIQGFCDASTTLKLSALQNILEYVQVNPKTLFFFDGALWAWNEMQWNKERVQMKLAMRGAIGEVAFNWLSAEARAEIISAFGLEDGTRVIDATNEYLNNMAVDNIEKAMTITGFINEDPMMVCSLGLQPQGITMPIRWLVSDGTSWIDTGIKNIDKDYTAKFKYKGPFSVGTRIDNTWQTYRSYRIGSTTPTSARADWPIGNTTQNLSWSEALLYDMEVSKGLLKVNGAIIYSGSVSSAVCPDYTYYVFAMNNFGSMAGCYEGQHFANHELIYKGTSVQNLVPFVSQTRDGMIDLVNMEFHPNQGTGHFTVAYTRNGQPWTPSTP